MKKTVLSLVVCFAAICAQAVSIVTTPGNPYEVAGLSPDPATGLAMSGMQVWARFSDGSTHTAAWGAGGVNVANWFSMSVVGNTYTFPWFLNNLSSQNDIVSFGFLGAPASVVFDKAFAGFGTPDSGNGLDLAFYDCRPATVIYSDIVNVAGHAAVGDIYASLKVALDDAPILAGSTVKFRQDTDNTIGKAYLPRVPDTGSTLALLSMALMGLFALPRRWAWLAPRV